MARSRLVLPAPLGPVSATASPAADAQARSPRTAPARRAATARSSTLSAVIIAAHARARGRPRMDARRPAVYETRGRSRGPTPRGAGRCVSASDQRATPRTDFRAALNRGKDPSNMASIDSFNTRRELTVGEQDLRLLQPRRGRRSRPCRHLPPAGLDEGAAGEPAAQRRRRLGHRGRPQGVRRLAREQGLGRARDQLPPGPGADAGLHRRAGGGRPGRHARRPGQAGRRPGEDQSAESRSTWSSTTR